MESDWTFFLKKKNRNSKNKKRKRNRVCDHNQISVLHLCVEKRKVSISSIRLPVVYLWAAWFYQISRKCRLPTRKSLSFFPSSFILLPFNLPKILTSPFFSTFFSAKGSLSPNSYLHKNRKGNTRKRPPSSLAQRARHNFLNLLLLLGWKSSYQYI